MTISENMDPLEVEKFSQLAHRWWDPESEFRPLHEINPLRLNWINSQVNLNNKKILDVGCGGGILSEELAKLGAHVTGIDLSEKALSVAKLHLYESQLDIDYQKISAEAFATQYPKQFDVVTCMELLEHVPEPASTIAACAALVKPGGWVFFSTINRNPKAYLFTVLGAEYVLNLLPRGTHDYAKFIKPSELVQYSQSAHLNAKAFEGLQYNPLSKQYTLSADISVNYMLATRLD